VVQVAAAALDHAAEVVGAIHVPLLLGEDQVAGQIGHRETVADADEEVIRRFGQVDGAGGCRMGGNLGRRQRLVGGSGCMSRGKRLGWRDS